MKRIFFLSFFVAVLLVAYGAVKIQIAGLERENAAKTAELENIRNQLDKANRVYADAADSERIMAEMQQNHNMERVDSRNIRPFRIKSQRDDEELP
ncbi:MAG: hypothetical protein LBQ97_09925 [Fusobacteriaceae bacterium]|jgi:regulator of replication initiation timing|nr:hypothetical protein [Fusobacteriaceae bacterium]